ncbi:2-oxo-4-hydroxy-4-carboxy-5-ureidoimidazoline decarboxylase [Nocardia sp. NPDC127579]|uniref:2-oxo-4-hydroxy-4-carboxy-5-ureidoimidazoline decarboxylase n=1 Tax=Nocardia sp. NPDC127579 TaxID=3345402 RepID=UPI00363B14F4
MTDESGLAGLNALPESAAEQALLSCCSAPEWARAVLAARPFSTDDELFAASDAASAALSESQIVQALAGHPRIGAHTDSARSAREQAGVAGADASVRAALEDGNRAYERQFGYRYLVCATGKSGAELLALLTARLGNDPVTERQVMRTELAKINRLRLAGLLGGSA